MIFYPKKLGEVEDEDEDEDEDVIKPYSRKRRGLGGSNNPVAKKCFSQPDSLTVDHLNETDGGTK